MSSTAMRALERADELQRQQEMIHNISFRFGLEWAKLEEEFRSKVMDHVDGSRGLKDYIVLWAKQFDRNWEDGMEDYIGKIDDFAVAKFQQLCGDVGKKIFAERQKIADPAVERAKQAEQAKQAVQAKIKQAIHAKILEETEAMKKAMARPYGPYDEITIKQEEPNLRPKSLFDRLKF